MANHKSAAKRARQNITKNKVNTARRSTVRTAEKAIAKALSEKNTKNLPELLKTYASKIQKAAQRGVISKNHAARKIAQFSKQVSSIVKK